MVSIFKSLNFFFQDLKNESLNNKTFIPILLVLISIPLSNVLTNVFLLILLLFSFVFGKKQFFKITTVLSLPVLLYLIMFFSIFWTINKEETLTALIKELPLLIVPLAFIFQKEFSKEQKQKLIGFYSYFVVGIAIYYLLRAAIRFSLFNDIRVFFYHGEVNNDFGLVPKLLNATHVSVFTAVALFYFISKEFKSRLDILYSTILFLFIVLLSSKNIIFVVIFLILINVFFLSKIAHKMRLRNIIVFCVFLIIILSIGKINQRIQVELKNNTQKSINPSVLEVIPNGVHYVSIKQAWTNATFNQNDFFPGTAFRVYQFRIFLEMLNDDAIFWKGYGLNASYPKIEAKGLKYHIYLGNGTSEGYQKKNFHNQYIQNFAELGLFGFLVLIIMLVINFKNAYKSKDFVHFAFAFLMISLFLTESFLWRQRGVVFFTMMYCLFNTGISLNSSKTE